MPTNHYDRIRPGHIAVGTKYRHYWMMQWASTRKKDRNAIVLRFFENRTPQEVADGPEN